MPTYKVKDPAVVKTGLGRMMYHNRVYATPASVPDVRIFADDTATYIAGVVKDTTGAVVVGATVKLFRQRDDMLVATATSSGTGTYSFARSPRDTNTYYVVAYSTAAGTQIHGTSERSLAGT